MSPMSAVLRIRALPLLALTTLGACIPAYRPPTQSEPHAVLKIRRTYDMQPGTGLKESVLVDDHLLLDNQVPAVLAREPRIDSSLVHPTPATFAQSSQFFHTETRLVDETYYEQEPYTDLESYSCGSGYGTNAVYRTCTRSVTRYRSVSRHRQVYKRVEVTDAACSALLRFAPAVDRVYLLQYSFQEHQACSLSCFEQAPNPDGTFSNSPCPPAPAVK